MGGETDHGYQKVQVRWGGGDLPADTSLLLWGQGTCCGAGLLPRHKNTPPLCSFAFFYCAVWDLPGCLAAASVLWACPCTPNCARAPDPTVHTGTPALQLLARC